MTGNLMYGIIVHQSVYTILNFITKQQQQRIANIRKFLINVQMFKLSFWSRMLDYSISITCDSCLKMSAEFPNVMSHIDLDQCFVKSTISPLSE